MTKKIFSSRYFYLCLLALVLAGLANFVSSEYIQSLYPNRLPIIDLIFDNTPTVMWTQYITDIAVLLSGLVIFYYILKYEIDYFPYFLFVIAMYFAFRAVIIPLNPFGGYWGNMNTYGISKIMQHGAFPSGHTGFAVVAYMLADKSKSRVVKLILYILVLAEIVSLIFSRGHYTIDIIGGLLLGYFVVHEFQALKKYLTL